MSKPEEFPTHVYWDERDQGFVAIAPDLPGCSAFGDTREDALKEVEVAIQAWIDSAQAAGEPIPEPSKLPRPSSYSGKILLRIPPSLHERLAKEAEIEGVSLNQWLVTVLASNSIASRGASRGVAVVGMGGSGSNVASTASRAVAAPLSNYLVIDPFGKVTPLQGANPNEQWGGRVEALGGWASACLQTWRAQGVSEEETSSALVPAAYSIANRSKGVMYG